MTGERYWYLTVVYWCPVCLSEKRERTRQHGPRPAEWSDRNRWVQAYDWCEP